VEITKEGLLRVAKSEDFIKSEFKLKSIRVRDDGQDIARIEFMKEDLILIKNTRMVDMIREKLRSYGYDKIILDKIGYRPNVPSI
jgi:PP-loop superfamily ATP-utilizing enzyme